MQNVTKEQFSDLVSTGGSWLMTGLRYGNCAMMEAGMNILNALDSMMCKGEWLLYWICDLCFGTESKADSVYTDEGNVPYQTEEEVYSFLTSEMPGAWRTVDWGRLED